MLNDLKTNHRESLGRMVSDIWNEWLKNQHPDIAPQDILPWEELPDSEKELNMLIGEALYNAGFEAGADSTKFHEGVE